jgi:hypothetical protein
MARVFDGYNGREHAAFRVMSNPVPRNRRAITQPDGLVPLDVVEQAR